MRGLQYREEDFHDRTDLIAKHVASGSTEYSLPSIILAQRSRAPKYPSAWRLEVSGKGC